VVLEGYGQTVLTSVDQAVQLDVLADQAGSFDVRLRERGTRLTTLVVQ